MRGDIRFYLMRNHIYINGEEQTSYGFAAMRQEDGKYKIVETFVDVSKDQKTVEEFVEFCNEQLRARSMKKRNGSIFKKD